jgi:pimeloyl-ACP methyl ester carboxylesterase
LCQHFAFGSSKTGFHFSGSSDPAINEIQIGVATGAAQQTAALAAVMLCRFHGQDVGSEGTVLGRLLFNGLFACLILLGIATARAERASEIVAYDDVRIEVLTEGRGPPVVLLPSRGRAAADFDEVAAGIAKAGFRVLRPQPRGAGRSTGPMNDRSLHDFARDIAVVIRHENGGPAVVVGHAFGSWVARMTAVDHPQLVRGVAIVAAAAKAYPAGFDGAKSLSEAVRKSGDPALSDAERLNDLRIAFFAPGNDASAWLQGWYPAVDAAQFTAGRATTQSEWWSGGTVPLLDLQGALDPFKPRAMAHEITEEFGERATIVVIPNASHALLPEQPAAIVEAIVAWIAKLPRKP